MVVIKPHSVSTRIVINISKQTLKFYQACTQSLATTDLINQDKLQEFVLVRTFKVSTAKNGIGNLEGTGCTPLGQHIIAEKIGASNPINTIYVGRQPTGEIYSTQLAKDNPNRDWILSRIMWLLGLQEGVNKGVNSSGVCDTYNRYIYIHGTPDSEPMGIPLSHGCIRMRNDDIIELFNQVDEGTIVEIVAT